MSSTRQALVDRVALERSPGTRQGAHIAELQRRRLLSATVELLTERGARAVNIAAVSQRAGVSRKTFYEAFADREACLLAAFEETTQQIEQVLRDAVADQRGTLKGTGTPRSIGWRERVRIGLVALLAFLDREPAAGRFVVVEALGAGEPTLQARRRTLDRLVELVDEGRSVTRRTSKSTDGREPPPLTAEGIVGAVFSVVHTRMLDRDPHPLSELAGPLTAMVVQPYLGVSAAQREIAAPAPTPTLAATANRPTPVVAEDPFKDLPMRLTYRTVLVLSSIAQLGEQGSQPSSKQVASAAGVSDQGQMSRLLARLQRFGMVENLGGETARGEAKAWALTSRGEGVLRVVGEA